MRSSTDEITERLAVAVYSFPRRPLSTASLVAIVALLLTYGGIRSPDAEVMFRTAERLADAGTFALDHDLEDWPDFGLPKGVDGQRYQWFGPAQSLYEAPFVPLARWIGGVTTRVAPGFNPPPSHYFQAGIQDAVRGRPVLPAHRSGHMLRSVVCLLDVLTLILLALVLHRTFLTATENATMAGWCTVATVLGTPLLNYATTLFSELLATLFCSLALLQVMCGDPDLARPSLGVDERLRRMVAAGVAVSLAASAHITALLFIPLLVLYAWRNSFFALGYGWRIAARRVFVLILATLPVLAWMCYMNWQHFGSVFETGRGVTPGWWVRGFVSPWIGLYGLTLSPGKGLLWFAPLACLGVVPGIAVWRRSSLPWIAQALLCYVVFRLIFLSARADWHAGFGLGPRYMMMALPSFMLVGALAWRALRQRDGTGRPRDLALVSAAIALAVLQQLYFASGEIFLFTYSMREAAATALRQGQRADIFLDWAYTPLWGLLDAGAGPWLYRVFRLNPRVGWLLGAELTVLVALLAYRGARGAPVAAPHPPSSAC